MSVIHRNQTTRNYNLSVIQPCVLRSCNDQEVFVMLSAALYVHIQIRLHRGQVTRLRLEVFCTKNSTFSHTLFRSHCVLLTSSSEICGFLTLNSRSLMPSTYPVIALMRKKCTTLSLQNLCKKTCINNCNTWL